MTADDAENNSVPPSRPRQWSLLSTAILAAILLAGALLRAMYLFEIAAEPTFDCTVYDPQYNDYWARGLATGHWVLPPDVNDPRILTTPHGRPPGYPYFLAAVYKLFGVNYFVPRLVQMALGLINALLLYLLGKRLFGNTAGLIAAAFGATYWAFPYYEGILTYPSVVIFLLLALMLVLEKWLREPDAGLAFGAGLLFGLFGLFRPNGLLFGPVLVAWMFWILRGRGVRFRSFLLTAACLTVGTLAVIAPTALRNYRVAHDFVFISSYGGLNFYAGNHEGACLTEPRIPELRKLAGMDNWSCFDYPAIVRGLARSQGRDGMTFSEANRYFYRQAFDYIRAHPGEAALNTLKKALLFWGPAEITNDTMPALDKAHSKVLRWLPGFPWMAALFVLGLLAWWFERRDAAANPARWALLLFVITYFLSVIPYFIAGRYRMPIMPFLALFGAYGVAALAKHLRARHVGTAAAMLVVACVAFALASWNLLGYEPNESTWHFRRALAFEAHNDMDAALAEYQRALALPGVSSAAAGNLGRLYMARGENTEAKTAFAKSLALAPDDAATLNSLGYLLATEGDLEGAVARYREAIAALPDFALAYNNLGYALEQRGKTDEARVAYVEALRADPRSALARMNLGNLLMKQGAYAEACEHFAALLRQHPGDANVGARLKAAENGQL